MTALSRSYLSSSIEGYLFLLLSIACWNNHVNGFVINTRELGSRTSIRRNDSYKYNRKKDFIYKKFDDDNVPIFYQSWKISIGNDNLNENIISRRFKNESSNESSADDNKGTSYVGKHKWLGGAVDSVDGCIYGIPAHSSNVLCLEPNIDGEYRVKMFPLPSEFDGIHFKWLRGIIHGRYLYGIPAWANAGVLRVDLRRWKQLRQKKQDNNGCYDDKSNSNLKYTEEDINNIIHILPLPDSISNIDKNDGIKKKLIPPNNKKQQKRWQWHGASLNANKTAIYAIPSNSEQVLKVNLTTQTTSYLPLPENTKGEKSENSLTNKWYGGILGWDNAIYGIPYAASGILRIDANTDKISILGNFGYKQYNWHGGALSEINGAIYAYPAHAMNVLKIDTAKNEDSATVSTSLLPIQRACYDNDTVTRYKWLGGTVGADGCIYGIPSDASSILCINPRTDLITTIAQTSNDKNKWQGGVLSPKDGCIYAIPSNALQILRIDTNPFTAAKNESDFELVSFVGSLPSKKDKWQGGFVGLDGDIYGIPENFDKIMKLTTGIEPTIKFLDK